MKKILITGGAGFVGSSLAKAFCKDDSSTKVVAFDNLKRRGSELNIAQFQSAGIEFVHGDIRNTSDLNDLAGDFDLLIEASAEPSVLAGLKGSPQYLIDTNLNGTLNCLEFARKRADKMIFLSTSRVYSIGPLKSIPLTETATRFESGTGITESFPTQLPRSLYGATKLASEMMIQEYVFSYGLKAIINRCGVIAGPGQFGKSDQGVFTLWVANHYFNRPLKYTGFGGAGKQVRDLLHPLDLYTLIRKQLMRAEEHSGEIYNVGGGMKNAVSLQELTQICRRIVGKQVPVSSDLNTANVDIPWFVTDSTKVSETFQWAPERTVETIIKEIFEWIQKNESLLEPLFCQ